MCGATGSSTQASLCHVARRRGTQACLVDEPYTDRARAGPPRLGSQPARAARPAAIQSPRGRCKRRPLVILLACHLHPRRPTPVAWAAAAQHAARGPPPSQRPRITPLMTPPLTRQLASQTHAATPRSLLIGGRLLPRIHRAAAQASTCRNRPPWTDAPVPSARAARRSKAPGGARARSAKWRARGCTATACACAAAGRPAALTCAAPRCCPTRRV